MILIERINDMMKNKTREEKLQRQIEILKFERDEWRKGAEQLEFSRDQWRKLYEQTLTIAVQATDHE